MPSPSPVSPASALLDRRSVLACLVAGTGALAGCNAGVVEPRVRRPIDAAATVPVDDHAAWRFSLDRDRRGWLDLEERAGDARCTTLTPARYEAYAAHEPVPESDEHAFATWLDDGQRRIVSQIPAGEWVVLCENVGAIPAEVRVMVSVETWVVDLADEE
ncbi:hypothetical protein [Salinigranum sp. GCM10025319]|uniref:hypothetical protein n=1 Tax=Salinigranum sp. GCM10025319 TaxID=3252687 RepID=UPI00361B08AA